jgi:hypothetical protein
VGEGLPHATSSYTNTSLYPVEYPIQPGQRSQTLNLTVKRVWNDVTTGRLELLAEVSGVKIELKFDEDLSNPLREAIQHAAEEQFTRKFIVKDALGKLDENDVAGILAAGGVEVSQGEDLQQSETQQLQQESVPGDPTPPATSHGQMDNLMRQLGIQIGKEQLK